MITDNDGKTIAIATRGEIYVIYVLIEAKWIRPDKPDIVRNISKQDRILPKELSMLHCDRINIIIKVIKKVYRCIINSCFFMAL